MPAKSGVSTTVSFGVAVCQVLGLNPDSVQNLSIHLGNGHIRVEATIWPSREELQAGIEAMPTLKHYRLVEGEDGAS